MDNKRNLKTQEEILEFIKESLEPRLDPTLIFSSKMFCPLTFKPSYSIKYRGTDKIAFKLDLIDIEQKKIVEENIKARLENIERFKDK